MPIFDIANTLLKACPNLDCGHHFHPDTNRIGVGGMQSCQGNRMRKGEGEQQSPAQKSSSELLIYTWASLWVALSANSIGNSVSGKEPILRIHDWHLSWGSKVTTVDKRCENERLEVVAFQLLTPGCKHLGEMLTHCGILYMKGGAESRSAISVSWESRLTH